MISIIIISSLSNINILIRIFIKTLVSVTHLHPPRQISLQQKRQKIGKRIDIIVKPDIPAGKFDAVLNILIFIGADQHLQ